MIYVQNKKDNGDWPQEASILKEDIQYQGDQDVFYEAAL